MLATSIVSSLSASAINQQLADVGLPAVTIIKQPALDEIRNPASFVTLSASIVAGVKMIALLQTRDNFGNPRAEGMPKGLAISASLAGDPAGFVSIEDLNTGLLLVNVKSTRSGQYFLSITIGDDLTSGSPYVLEVEAATLDTTASKLLTSAGFEKGMVGDALQLTVQVRNVFCLICYNVLHTLPTYFCTFRDSLIAPIPTSRGAMVLAIL